MQYGIINSDALAHYNANWQGDGAAPSDVALAIALAMPSVSEGGVRPASAALKRPGLTTYYHACALRHGDNVSLPNAGVHDLQFAVTTNQASPSNKTNHLKWLTQAGLVVNTRVNGQRISCLTDAGVAQVALIDKGLGKLAKAYTVAARDKALKALAKAEKPVKASKPKARKPKAEKPVTEVPEVPVTEVPHAGSETSIEAQAQQS